ncbi:MAG: hypothetical protein EZS28_006158 [Streblomastix strix]|uniref:Uncharacterized protein n=1 Tax=Streblomastix strix TaxID=222440 RepID=A0A5J4WTS7_9EUKA|nr:MAG: hypothetical protein EZS28_006158 [Streblomastix strix]
MIEIGFSPCFNPDNIFYPVNDTQMNIDQQKDQQQNKTSLQLNNQSIDKDTFTPSIPIPPQITNIQQLILPQSTSVSALAFHSIRLAQFLQYISQHSASLQWIRFARLICVKSKLDSLAALTSLAASEIFHSLRQPERGILVLLNPNYIPILIRGRLRSLRKIKNEEEIQSITTKSPFIDTLQISQLMSFASIRTNLQIGRCLSQIAGEVELKQESKISIKGLMNQPMSCIQLRQQSLEYLLHARSECEMIEFAVDNEKDKEEGDGFDGHSLEYQLLCCEKHTCTKLWRDIHFELAQIYEKLERKEERNDAAKEFIRADTTFIGLVQ